MGFLEDPPTIIMRKRRPRKLVPVSRSSFIAVRSVVLGTGRDSGWVCHMPTNETDPLVRLTFSAFISATPLVPHRKSLDEAALSGADRLLRRPRSP